MKVLNIDVPDGLATRWVDWLMPEKQPFVVPDALAEAHGWVDFSPGMSDEVRDSFEIYNRPSGHRIVGLNRADARLLQPEVRRAQSAAHLWRSTTADPARAREHDLARAVAFVEAGRRDSAHDAVTTGQWKAAAPLLPGARLVAGTFAESSGPNCFGAVMAAAGVPDAQFQWMQIDPFERWLAEASSPLPNGPTEDGRAGVVLVWREASGENAGQAAHAAVTLGGGWLLHKPSQGWMSPTKVLRVRDGMFSARQSGLHVHRYLMG